MTHSKLKNILNHPAINLAGLSNTTGIPVNTLRNIKRGKQTPQVGTLFAVSRAIKQLTNDLTNATDDNN